MKLVKLRPWLGSSGDILSSVVGRLLAPTLHLFVEGERSAYGSVSHCSFVLTAASLLELFPVVYSLSAYVSFLLLSLDLRFDCFELRSVAFN